MKSSTAKKLSKNEVKKLILTEVPRLIKKDAEIRDFILKISSERFADRKKTEERFEKLLDELRKDREENQRKWEENQKIINFMLEEIKLLHRKFDTTIGALGSRWGLRAESSFRNAIKDILEEFLPFKVERYLTMDEEGIVFGRPDQIELDLLIKDGLVIVAEIKSSISKPDVAAFLRKIQVYEKKEGRKVEKKLIISPMIDSRASEFALSNGIKVYGYPEEIDIGELQN